MRTNNRYGLVLWLGEGEQGKTTGMIRELYNEMLTQEIYTHAYCNLKSVVGKIPNVEHIKYEELHELQADNKNGVPTAILCLDQLHKYLDARQSGSSRNIYTSDVIIEARQHGFDVRGTTWSRDSIDKRFRRFNELQILCERTRHGVRYTYADIDTGRLPIKTVPFSEIQKYWKLFDTTELIEDIPPNWDPRYGGDPRLKQAARIRKQ